MGLCSGNRSSGSSSSSSNSSSSSTSSSGRSSYTSALLSGFVLSKSQRYLAGFDRMGLCCGSISSSGSSRRGSSRDCSRSKRVVLIISIVHTQFLLTAYDVTV